DRRPVIGHPVETKRLWPASFPKERRTISSLGRSTWLIQLRQPVRAFRTLSDEGNQFFPGGWRRCNPTYGYRRHTGKYDGHRNSPPTLSSSFCTQRIKYRCRFVLGFVSL